MPDRFCGHCGEQLGEGLGAARHVPCEQSLRLEPPRFCAQCRRRMVVQVTPTGWTAQCSRHGELSDVRADVAEGAEGPEGPEGAHGTG